MLHLATQLLRHDLLAVTNAQDRHARFVQMFGQQRSIVAGDGFRPAAKDDAFGLHPLERLGHLGVGGNFGIHPSLAHPSGDELRHLAAEIDDQDGIGLVFWVHGPALTGWCCAVQHRGHRPGKTAESPGQFAWEKRLATLYATHGNKP